MQDRTQVYLTEFFSPLPVSVKRGVQDKALIFILA